MSNKQAPPVRDPSDSVPSQRASEESGRSEESAREAVVEVSRHDAAPFDPYVRQEFAFTTQTRRTLLGLEPPKGGDDSGESAPDGVGEPEPFEGTWNDLPGSAGPPHLERSAPTVPSLRRRAALVPGAPEVASPPAAVVVAPSPRGGRKAWVAVAALALLSFGVAFAASGSGSDAPSNAPNLPAPTHAVVTSTQSPSSRSTAAANGPSIESSKAAAAHGPRSATPPDERRTSNAPVGPSFVSATPPHRASAPVRGVTPKIGQRVEAHSTEPTRPRNSEHPDANAAKKQLWFPPE